MLVEVEVYKGPLTKTPAVQLGEVQAVLHEAEKLLEGYLGQTRNFWNRRCLGLEQYDCMILDSMLNRGESVQKALTAFRREYERDARTLLQLGLAANGADRSKAAADELKRRQAMRNLIVQATDVATRLKIEAFYWAEVQIPDFPQDLEIRAYLVGFTNLSSELSNQLASRVDVLSKQFDDVEPLHRQVLPVSDYLKSAGPTDFLHLYDWYRAVSPDGSAESAQSNLTPEDRVRLAKRLFADHFWTKINEVHASGQGEVRMALIKDDIGNWNLKSFDNDPEQLLKAYRDLASAGIQGAIDLARNISTGGSAAGIEMLSQFARGKVGAAPFITADRLNSIRTRAVADLASLRDRVRSEQPALKDAEDKAKKAMDDERPKMTDARKEHEVALDARLKAEAALRGAPANANVADLRGQVDAALATENAKRDGAREAAKRYDELRTAHAEARTKHLEYTRSAIKEAKDIVSIHSRVVDGLKEIQVTPTSTKPLASSLPNLPTGLPVRR